MSVSRNRRVQAIRARAEFLEIRVRQALLEGRDLSYDKREARALRWALPILEGHLESHRLLHLQLAEEKKEREEI